MFNHNKPELIESKAMDMDMEGGVGKIWLIFERAINILSHQETQYVSTILFRPVKLLYIDVYWVMYPRIPITLIAYHFTNG